MTIYNGEQWEPLLPRIEAIEASIGMKGSEEGVWVAYLSDYGATVYGVFRTEVEALRCAQENHARAEFIRWGEGFK